MGCDIHMVLEEKHNDKWIGVCTYDWMPAEAIKVRDQNFEEVQVQFVSWKIRSRNYKLFGALANVRCEGPDPRGVPDDASDLARLNIERWGTDGHSHSWGLLSEVGIAFLAHNTPNQVLDKNRALQISRMFAIPELGNEIDLNKYRLIYWFDN